MSLFRSAATIGFFTMLSRVLGFVRDMCIARFMGASFLTDAFFVAFKLPNFMRRLFAEGAFNSAFVPLYAGTLSEEGKEAAKRLASEAFSVLFAILVVVVIGVEIFTPAILHLTAPGFTDDAEKFALTVTLTRICFPYILFISLVSLYGGILNSMDKFAAAAACPILLNIIMVVGLVGFGDQFQTSAHALSWAVAVAGFAQCLWLAVFCYKAGLLPHMLWPRITPKVKRLLVLIGPAALGAGVAQVNLMVDMIIATSVPEGVSYLYYADRITQLPLGIIGVGVGTALLPLLSKQMKAGNLAVAHHTQNRAIELVLLLTLPAAFALFIIAEPIIRTLYEHGAFTALASNQTYPALMAFACGLPAFVLIKALAPGFFANHDTKTPFYIATCSMVTNVVLCLVLVQFFAHVGLAVASAISSWLNVVLMGIILHKRNILAIDAKLRRTAPRILFASMCMMAALALGLIPLSPLFAGDYLWRIPALAALISLGGCTYAFALVSTGGVDMAELKGYFHRKK